MVYAVDINKTNYLPAKFGNIGALLNIIIPLLMTGAALLFLVMLLLGAFKWLTAGDSAESVKKAQSTITFAVLGIIIVTLSYLAVRVIGVILNLGAVNF